LTAPETGVACPTARARHPGPGSRPFPLELGSLVINKNNKSTINVAHQNMQGLTSKELEVDLFIDNYNIHVLCVTEHWLKSHEIMFNFKNHTVVSYFSRQKCIRGGSLIIINKNLKYKERKDIVRLSVERTIELSCAELDHFIIICVYRPPSADFTVFESIMEEALNKVFNSQKCILVCGDFNVNLLEATSTSSSILHLFKSYDLVNLFCEPTRVTYATATCIDNIFCTKDPIDKLVFNRLGSDHFGQLACFSGKVDELPLEILYRPITEERLVTFGNNIKSQLELLEPSIEDPDFYYSKLFNCIETEFNTCFKLKKVKCKDRVSFDEWATPGIHKSRHRLYELYALRVLNSDPNFNEYVKSYSKLFKNICIMAKSKYFARKVKDSNDKVKTVWRIISSETAKAKSRDPHFALKVGDKLVKSDIDVANEFERFFTNIPLETTRSLNSSSSMAENMLKAKLNAQQFSALNTSRRKQSKKRLGH
jgi:hypothetical protein